MSFQRIERVWSDQARGRVISIIDSCFRINKIQASCDCPYDDCVANILMLFREYKAKGIVPLPAIMRYCKSQTSSSTIGSFRARNTLEEQFHFAWVALKNTIHSQDLASIRNQIINHGFSKN